MALQYLKALADETRLRLFNILLHNELNVNELVELTGMGQSRISRHLKILTDSRLLSSRRDGLWVYYHATNIDETRSLVKFVREISENDTELNHDCNRARDIIRERKNRTKSFFNSIAGDWNRLKRDILGNLDLTSIIMQHVDPCDVAVDMGCGTGDLLLSLQENAETLIGVDNSQKMLNHARQRFTPSGSNVELRLGELEHLPLRDGEADVAIINIALHHLPVPLEGIREAYRVLKKNRKVIIAEFAKHNIESMRDKYGDRWLGFNKEEIIQWLQETGFQQIKYDTYNVDRGLDMNIFIARKSRKG